MSQLGERLRQARENQGLSLAQAAAETRIRQQALQALEEGAFDKLPNDVVVKGFLRNYAQVLHLPVDEMLDMYRLERGGSQPIRVISAGSVPRLRLYVLPSFFGVFFVTIALVGLTYVALSALGKIQDEQVVSRATTTPTSIAPTPTMLSTASPEDRAPQVAVEPTAEATVSSEPLSLPTLPPQPSPRAAGVASTPRPTRTPTPESTETPEAPIVLEVSILPGSGEGSWLRIIADGVTVYEQTMSHGERQIFLAQRQVQIRAGNPTFVQVSINGLPPETIGQVPGEPVDWSWPPR